jgi:hypothetical protein
VIGTIDGAQVPATDAVALSGTYTDTATSTVVQELIVVISNQTPLCTLLGKNSDLPSRTELALAVGSASSTPGVGTYTVNTGGTSSSDAYAEYQTTDSACGVLVSTVSTSGTMTLSSVTSTDVVGSFSFVFDTGDTLRGTFNVPICNVDLASYTTASTGVCGQ